MSALSVLNTISWWLLSHPTEFLWIVAILLGISAGLIGIKLVRKDVLSRMGVYRRRGYGDYEFDGKIRHTTRCQIRFSGLGFAPRLVIRDGKSKSFQNPIQIEWIVPNEWEHDSFPHWSKPSAHETPFWTDSNESFVIGIHEYEGRRSWRGGTKSVIGTIVVLAMVFGISAFLHSRGDSRPEATEPTIVVRETERAVEPTARPTATVKPTEDLEETGNAVLVDTDRMPETNMAIWDWLSEHMPNLPMPSVSMPIPGWFSDLFENADGGTVISMQGLPGYILVLRNGDTSVVVRLTEEMIPVTRTMLEVNNFTITAGDYNWKLSWDNTHWNKPVKGSHGKIEIVVGEDDELTINWKFSLLP